MATVNQTTPARIEVIDSHTSGEPTRVIIDGWPPPEGDTMGQRRESLRSHFDKLRQAVVCEPHGHSAMVGGLLTPPVNEGSLAGVVFFNDVGYLGMCGHGLIGVIETLSFMGKIDTEVVKIDTPAGTVSAKIGPDGKVTIANVASFVYRQDVTLSVPGLGEVAGDIAYGGNWFFMVESYQPEINLENLDTLMAAGKAVRNQLAEEGMTGADGAIIDHIEFFSAPTVVGADSKNFVLCPGNAYDRSPCGTGTSARMACLHARGKLGIRQKWVQESVTGSIFTGWLEREEDKLMPFVQGSAHVMSKATLFFDPNDEFCWGIS
jgi:4-hydroxyproline epimerase